MGLRVIRAAVIVAMGSGLGLAWNSLSGLGFALGRNVLIQDGDVLVDVAAAKARLDKGALFLDARPRDFYDMAHIPGSLSLPEEDFDKAFARLEPRLRSSLDVVVYCAGFGCEASHVVARKLKQKGIPADVLHEGWPAWQDAHYPERSGSEP
ncbi:MAG: rhodanese-like domain-containing protein [Vicinamibacteria bacterium]